MVDQSTGLASCWLIIICGEISLYPSHPPIFATNIFSPFFFQKAPGLDQYSIKKFGEAFEIVPITLAENAGLNSTEVISKLYAAQQAGKTTTGVNIDDEEKGILDAKAVGIFDAYLAKYWAIKYATDAAITVLRVDQIIMSKPSGGPKPKENKNWDEDPDPAQQAQ